MEDSFDEIKSQLGEASFVLKIDEKQGQEKAAEAAAGPKMVTMNVVLR